jgi:hypothetical protein
LSWVRSADHLARGGQTVDRRHAGVDQRHVDALPRVAPLPQVLGAGVLRRDGVHRADLADLVGDVGVGQGQSGVGGHLRHARDRPQGGQPVDGHPGAEAVDDPQLPADGAAELLDGLLGGPARARRAADHDRDLVRGGGRRGLGHCRPGEAERQGAGCRDGHEATRVHGETSPRHAVGEGGGCPPSFVAAHPCAPHSPHCPVQCRARTGWSAQVPFGAAVRNLNGRIARDGDHLTPRRTQRV